MKNWNRRTKVVALSVILTLLFAAIYAAGILLPEDLAAPSIRSPRLSPSVEHLFGPDALGRDLALQQQGAPGKWTISSTGLLTL